MIYFQICIFEPLETTIIFPFIKITKLWFTFKFVSLNHWKQHVIVCIFRIMCCDLLSNLYLWTIGNNISRRIKWDQSVVIYFQICIFEPLETTVTIAKTTQLPLWFTFKFVSLNHWKQHCAKRFTYPSSCDLLSNLYLWTIGNNRGQHLCHPTYVVIYFQICIFEPLETTRPWR